MREAPTYAVSNLVADKSPTDPLGLAAGTDQLVDWALPGINNKVRYVRAYSALCWMAQQAWTIASSPAGAPVSQPDDSWDAAIEKMDLLLAWANRDAPNVPGKTRPLPPPTGKTLLRLAQHPVDKERFFHSDAYKPSLTSGLGLLQPEEGGRAYQCTALGRELSQAFDDVASSCPGYKWLKSPVELEGSFSQIKKLRPALAFDQVSPAERQAFLNAFFPSSPEQSADESGRRRWATLQLMLRCVHLGVERKRHQKLSGVVTEQEVRECMARGVLPDGIKVYDASTLAAQQWWAVVQLRRLQRIALESLNACVEYWIQLRASRSLDRPLTQCLSELAAAIDLSADGRMTTEQALQDYRRLQGRHPSLYEACALSEATQSGDFRADDLFWHIQRLQEGATAGPSENDNSTVAHAVQALLFCAVETKNLAANPAGLLALRLDGGQRSLLELTSWVESRRAEPLQSLGEGLLRDWVVLHHFLVAAARGSSASDGKTRLRYAEGDHGLELVMLMSHGKVKPPKPLARDRLLAAMALCTNAGLLIESAHGYRLSAAGLSRLS